MEKSYFKEHPGYREIEVSNYPKAKLRLVAPSLKYAAASLSWVLQPDVMQYMGADLSNISLAGEVTRLQKIIDNKDAYNWMIEVDGVVVGNRNINMVSQMSKKYGGLVGKSNILIGDKNYWGKGISTATAKAVLNWAFNEGSFDAIVTRVMPENTASLAVVKKMGYLPVGEETETIAGKTIKYLVFKLDKSVAKVKGICLTEHNPV